MQPYNMHVLVSDDGTVIALRHVESIKLDRTNEQAVVNILKEDYSFDIITLSGMKYTISVKTQITAFQDQTFYGTHEEIAMSIFEKWIYTISNYGKSSH